MCVRALGGGHPRYLSVCQLASPETSLLNSAEGCLALAVAGRGIGICCGNSFSFWGTSPLGHGLRCYIWTDKWKEEACSLSWEVEQKQAFVVGHVSLGQSGGTRRLPSCLVLCESVFPFEFPQQEYSCESLDFVERVGVGLMNKRLSGRRKD